MAYCNYFVFGCGWNPAEDDYHKEFVLPNSAKTPDVEVLDGVIRCLTALEQQRDSPYWSPSVKIVLTCMRHIKDHPSSAIVDIVE